MEVPVPVAIPSGSEPVGMGMMSGKGSAVAGPNGAAANTAASADVTSTRRVLIAPRYGAIVDE